VSNAATFLLDFFNPSGKSSFKTCHLSDIAIAMGTVDSTLYAASRSGDQEATIALSCMPQLWQACATAWERNNKTTMPGNANTQLGTAETMALYVAARLLESGAAAYPEDRRKLLSDLVKGIPDLLKDLALPEDLKKYVLGLAHETSIALDEYAVTGDFKLDAAFSRLQTALNVIAATPKPVKEQGKVMTFLNEKMIPCLTVLSLASSSSANMIESYQFYNPSTQIEQSQPSDH
jgi:hypothetical protein